MKKNASIVLAGLLFLAGGIYAGSKYIDSGGQAMVTVPIVAADTTELRDYSDAPLDTSALVLPAVTQQTTVAADVTEAATQSSVALDISVAPAGAQTVKTRAIHLHRIDWSGMYALPDSITAQDVVTVYLDGRQIAPDRVAIAGPGDRLDVFDARLDSVVTAKIIKQSKELKE